MRPVSIHEIRACCAVPGSTVFLVTMKPRIRSVSLCKYAKVANELGIDPLRMFRQVGLDHSCLSSPDLMVPEAAFAQLLEASSAQAGTGSPAASARQISVPNRSTRRRSGAVTWA